MHKCSRVVVCLLVAAALAAACSSTTRTVRTDNDSNTPPKTSVEPAPEPSPPPPEPVIDDFAAEHDKSRAPDVPKSIEVPFETSKIQLPSETAQEFFAALEAKWEVTKSANRGESDSGLHRYDDFRWGNYLPLCICESRAVDDWKYGHGRAVMTFDRLAKDSLLADWSLAGSSTLAIGYLRFGKMHGPWMFRNATQAMKGEAGPLHFICEYDRGVAHGECRWYTPDGQPKGRSYYKGGEKEGEQLERVGGGISQRQYTGGVERGLYRRWNDQGQLVERGMAYNNRFWGKAEFWHPGETRYYRVRYIKPGTDNSWMVAYDKDGQLVEQRWVEGTLSTGPFIEYHPGSFIKATGTLKNGAYDGVVYFKFNHRSANQSAVTYKEGKRHGGYWEYYESGKLKVRADYKNDVLDGPYKTYAEDGTLISEQLYENGELHDPARQWPAPGEVLDANGQLIDRRYGHWRTETHKTQPTAEVGMAMAYHEKLGGVVIFGGRKAADGESIVNETWLRKDGKWQRIFEGKRAPIARDYAAMTYDSKRGVAVLFGGRMAGNYFMQDTWELGVDGWKQRTKEPLLTANPDPRAAASLAYDPRRGVCVLVGGLGRNDKREAEVKSAVWEWDGTDWKWAGAGPALHSAAMAYDEQRKRMVLHGGKDIRMLNGKPADRELGATWVYNGTSWQQCKFLVEARANGHAMVYDPEQRALLLLRNEAFAGRVGFSALIPERTSVVNAWRPVREDDPAVSRTNFAAAYDVKARTVVVYGGEVRDDSNKWKGTRDTLTLTDETPQERAAATAKAKLAAESVPGWTLHDNGDFATADFMPYAIHVDRKRGVPVMIGASARKAILSGDSSQDGGNRFVVYERHGGVWKLIPASNAPGVRTSYGCWFDARSGLLMLYGGRDNKESLSDLWSWDGRNWRCIAESTPGAPTVEDEQPFGWDDKRGVLVTIVWVGPEGQREQMVHEFDGTKWVNTGVGMPGDYGCTQLVYDPVAERLLMPYPQDYLNGVVSTEAFYWDGTEWEAAGLSLPKIGAGNLLYPDHAGRALWQLSDNELRMCEGTEWRAWEQPSGLRPAFSNWQSLLWIDAGRVFVQGFKPSLGAPARNDTLSFDPAKGKLRSVQAIDPWPGPVIVNGGDGRPIRRRFGHWRVETANDMPPAEMGMAMAYHEKLGGIVLFGGVTRDGTGSRKLNETWLRKDGKWQRLFADGTAPQPRDYAAMAYDSKRGVIVLYGGRGARVVLDDVWELDANGWKQCTPTNFAKEARAGASLVYDSHRGVCVLIGGLGVGSGNKAETRSDVLEWDGKDWTRASDQASTGDTAAVKGPALFSAAATYDELRRCIIVHGGQDAANKEYKDTWVLQHGKWSKLEMSDIGTTSMHAMVYDADARRVVLLRNMAEKLVAQSPTGTSYFAVWDEIRQFDDPPVRRNFAAAYDRGTREIVLFGGAHRDLAGKVTVYRETLVLTDEADADRAKDLADFTAAALTAPGWRVIDNGELSTSEVLNAATARDPKRGVIVMFGGSDGVGYLDETREFRDGKWHLMQPATKPRARYGAAMWYDPKRGTVMMYGGMGRNGYLTDLWEWNGQDWTCIHKSVHEGPGINEAAFDAKRGVLVALVYGKDGRYVHEFDGIHWTATGVKAYGASMGGEMVYDPIAEMVLFARRKNEATFENMALAWHWDGKAWIETKAIMKDMDITGDFALHADLEGKAIWHAAGGTIRRFDGKEWKVWKAPAGLDPWACHMWFEAGKVYAHGTIRQGATVYDNQRRSDTLVFDQEKGEPAK